jgi:2-polyprenyl-6-methoxyphenol hydroxylase-like FAD-dependent oxidoreductase
VAASDTVERWLGATLTGYSADADGGTADIKDSSGEAIRLRAKYFVGTDGGRKDRAAGA